MSFAMAQRKVLGAPTSHPAAGTPCPGLWAGVICVSLFHLCLCGALREADGCPELPGEQS